MRRARYILAAVLMAAGLFSVTAAGSPESAKKDIYNTYSVRGCQVYQGESPNSSDGHACLKIWYKRQEDGTGVNIKTRRIGMWTEASNGAISDNCGSYFNNPAVKYSSVSVYLTLSRQWGPATSEPTDGNGCAVQWNTDVGVNGIASTVWEFRPDINGGFDGSERTINIGVGANGTWGCNVNICDREGPL